MNTDLKIEDILFRVRDQLNKSNIKLWLDPYYSDKGVGSDEMVALQLLSEQISELLNIDQEYCISTLKELQNRALSHLKSNEIFKATGIANLKVKVSGKDPVTVSVDIPLTSSTQRLIEEVAQMTNISNERLKLISRGRVLQPTETLLSQGVKNASQLMAVVMDNESDLKESEKRFKTLESTKKDLKFLTGHMDSNNDRYFQIENQSGEALNIPPHEHKALVTAMGLHEKGRAALKKKDYALALVLFLEADKEYSDCTSQLLNACDNYALLHLDIAWCYLCLHSAAQIPDADRRLSLCEQSFHKSYGPNMERLLAIKGTTGNEMCLFMRLHLLQGVVHFHQNRREDAKKMFERALSELNSLNVDDNTLSLLMELGYSSAEARIGLRATYGNIEAAIELINRKRKERELAREQNLLKLKQERESMKLGLCQDGKQYCDPSLVSQLQAMGFNRSQSIEALKMANNVISEAISIIQDTPHLLQSSVTEDLIAKVASLGYDVSTIRDLFDNFPSQSLEKVIRSLSTLPDSSGASSSTMDNQLTRSASAISLIEDLHRKRKRQIEEGNKAVKRFSKDLVNSDLTEDHLDLNLEEENVFLMEYMSLLD